MKTIKLLVLLLCITLLKLSAQPARIVRVNLKQIEYHYQYEKGEIIGVGKRVDSVKHGYWRYYYDIKDSVRHSEGVYDMGRKIGTWRNYFPLKDKRIRSSETWMRGNLYRWCLYDEDNTKRIVIEADSVYPITQGIFDYIKKIDDQYPKYYLYTFSSSEIIVDDVINAVYNAMHEILTSFSVNCSIQLTDEKNNIKEKYWYKVGATYEKDKYTYSGGKLVRKEHYKGDVITERELYDEWDKSQYTYTLYFANGSRNIEGIMNEERQKHGNWKEFYESGGVKSSGKYAKGLKEGKWILYDLKGDKIGEENYLKGEK